ncbi:MAG: lysyl oxidase family protein [Actinomycetota bacterium]
MDRAGSSRHSSRLLAVVLAITLGVVTVGVHANAGASDPTFATLGVDDEVFWEGPYVRRARNSFGAERACREGPCWEYRIELSGQGSRFRVAIDYPPGNDTFALFLRGPNGKRRSPEVSGFFSHEIFVERPKPGPWTVEVVPRNATKTAFRARAKLEGRAPRPHSRRLLAPNLRVEPPFGFTFETPAIIIPGGTVSIPSDRSCGLDESAEQGAQECLRFWVGPQNAGRGPLELRFAPATEAAAGEAPMYQILHYSDGTTRERRSGSYEFHKTHGHYHFRGFAAFELFRVTDPRAGRLEGAGSGNKSGFCFGDVLMNSWEEFIQAPAGSARSACAELEDGGMGLATGWTDVYSAGTPGNYVEFSEQGDGRYVLRATVDLQDEILETNEADNVSYAYIEVQGRKVRVLERGFGLSPWDHGREVLIDWVARLRR